MALFKPLTVTVEKPLIVAVEPGSPVSTDELREGLTQLKDHPSFRMLLRFLRTQTAYVDSRIIGGKHESLASLSRLQGIREGLHYVEALLKRMSATPAAAERSVGRTEKEVFEQVKGLLEEVK